jgi:hypothetical protein
LLKGEGPRAQRGRRTRGRLYLSVTGYMLAGPGQECPSGGRRGDEEPFEDRAALGYDHAYDAEVFYLGLALDPACVEGFVKGCLERIGEDNPHEEDFLRGT